MRAVFAMVLVGVALVLVSGCGGDASSGAQSSKEEAGDLEAAKTCLAQVQKPSRVDSKPPPAGKGSKLVILTLDGLADAEVAGILLAYERGYFAKAGLEIELHSPVVSRNVAKYLDEEVIDLGVMTQPQVVMSNEHGMPLVAVGSVVPQPAMAMMWLPGSGIDRVADFAGKTIAINGLPWEEAVLEALLAEEGLTLDDITLRHPGYGLVSTLLDGSADAILGVSANVEGVELEACGVKTVVTPLGQLGVPAFEELQVVARRDRVTRGSWWIKAFISAAGRGTAAAIEDPGAAVEAIAAARIELGYAEPQVPASSEAKVEATLPLLSRSGGMDPVRAARLSAWMKDRGLIEREVPVSELLTTRFTSGDRR